MKLPSILRYVGITRIIVGLLVGAAPSLAAPPRDEALEGLLRDYFRHPEFTDFLLSPRGDLLAYSRVSDNNQTVAVLDLEAKKSSSVDLQSGQQLTTFAWESDNTLVLELNRNFYYWDGIHAFRPRQRRVWPVLTFGKTERIAHLIDTTPRQPNSMIVAYRDPRREIRGIFQVEITMPASSDTMGTQSITRGGDTPVYQEEILKDAENLGGLLIDSAGVIRLVQRLDKTQGWRWFYRGHAKEDWRPLEWGEYTHPLAFLADERSLLVSSPREGDTYGLHVFDPDQGTFVHTFHQDPVYDVRDSTSKLLRELGTGRVVGVRTHRQKPLTLFLDPVYSRLQRRLAEAMPERISTVLGILPDGQTGFVYSTSDRYAGGLYQIDLASGQMRLLAERRPWLKESRQQPCQPIEFPTRDGAVVQGYLTRPEQSAEGPSPLLVIVHGGHRDQWEFSGERQFFAALGYAVLQVNYRGSLGFGRTTASYPLDKVCRMAVEDVADGVRWAVAQGYAKSGQVAIYGYSLGATAALAGATFEPDLYRCAIGGAGVYDFATRLESYLEKEEVPDWLRELWRLVLEDKRETLLEISPLSHLDQLRCPVLLLHGDADTRIDADQAKRYRKALEKAGKAVESESWTWLGHGLWHEDLRIQYYRRMAEFLRQHLPVEGI